MHVVDVLEKAVRLQVPPWVIQTLITKLSMVIVHISEKSIEIRSKLKLDLNPVSLFAGFLGSPILL